jgi:predicted transcriptional regulator
MKEAEVVWALAQIQPATAKEISNFLDTDAGSHNSTVLRVYRQGLAMRRKREAEGYGPSPYEYALTQKE